MAVNVTKYVFGLHFGRLFRYIEHPVTLQTTPPFIPPASVVTMAAGRNHLLVSVAFARQWQNYHSPFSTKKEIE
jgi:hypothetical protein